MYNMNHLGFAKGMCIGVRRTKRQPIWEDQHRETRVNGQREKGQI